ncbi:MAG TPA: hypothetical protein DCL54_10970, partial [Alphaproteobacteria bacterium]|nr:hypothetical protein [Alphaproteobacteria bacterium]
TALARPQLKPAGAVAVAAKDRPAGVGGPLIPAKPQQVAAVETKRPADEEKQELDPVPAAERPAVANNTFIWPVTGRIVSSFGERANGARNDGLNIAVPAGTPVKAADTGTVIYAGNELPGFGNLVLVKHSNGYVTAYAHNSKLLVRKGDKVSQGQAIAKAGRTGGVDVPQVHFEIRRGDKPVDPRRYIGNPDMNASL